MRCLVSDIDGRFQQQEAPEPRPGSGELLVRVKAASVNPRDLRMAGLRPGFRPGVDFAGVVERAAGRSGPQAGARVAGVLGGGGTWSEMVAAPLNAVAILQDPLSFETGAAIASTGLTALYALERGGPILGRRVLVTAAAGGVGRLACQLAALEGAEVVASVRSQAGAADLAGLGLQVVVDEDVGAAKAHGPFHLIVDSVGGESLRAAVRLLAPGGTCVVLGATAGNPSAIDAAELYQSYRTLVGFGLFPELAAKPPAQGLPRLYRLVEQGRLSAPVVRKLAFADVNQAFDDPGRGKLVVSLDGG